MTSNRESGPMPTVAFVGAGNMAQALIGGLLDRQHPADRLRAADPGSAAREQVAGLGPVHVTGDNAAAVAGADVVVLAVKPQVIDNVAGRLADALDDGALVVSVAAGVDRKSTRLNSSHYS